MNLVMRWIIFPNVVAHGVGIILAPATQDKILMVAGMVLTYPLAIWIGHRIWK